MDLLCHTVRYWTFVPLYGICSFLMWCYDDVIISYHIIKWSHICFKVVPIDKMIFPHWKSTFGGLYQAFRSIFCFSVQCDTLLENQISEVFLTINERIWTIPSKYVIPNMKPLQYSGFGHKNSLFALKPWITQKPYSVTFMLALF